MDVAVMETYTVGSDGAENPDYRFVHDLRVEPLGDDDFRLAYVKDEDPGLTAITLVKDDDRQFVGTASHGRTIRVRPPTPDDAIIMGHAGVAQPLEVVNAHIAESGGILAQALEAVVDGANEVLAVILRTGLGVYFRENGAWQMKRTDPRLMEGTTLQILAPEALDYWDDADEPMTIYDLPFILDGEVVDPSERELADGPAEEDEEVP